MNIEDLEEEYLEELSRRCMEKDPSLRPDAMQLLQELLGEMGSHLELSTDLNRAPRDDRRDSDAAQKLAGSKRPRESKRDAEEESGEVEGRGNGERQSSAKEKAEESSGGNENDKDEEKPRKKHLKRGS